MEWLKSNKMLLLQIQNWAKAWIEKYYSNRDPVSLLDSFIKVRVASKIT